MKSETKFKIKDILLILMMVLPFLCAIILNILTKPASDEINVTGAQIYFTVKMPIQNLYITEAQITSLCVMISLLALCLFLTHGISKTPKYKRQLIAEVLVEKVQNFVNSNMGERFSGFAPFVASVMGLSALSSLSSLLGLLSRNIGFEYCRGLGDTCIHSDHLLQNEGGTTELSEKLCGTYSGICSF